jgi:hypothetical protein
MQYFCPVLNQPCKEKACGWWHIQECGVLTIARSIEHVKFKMR